MKWFFPLLVCVALCLCVAGGVLAVDATATNPTGASTDGEVGIALTKQLYCDGKNLVQGNLGVLLGLMLVFKALWGMINGGSAMTGLILVVCGALITALPGMVESTFSGVSDALKQSGITTAAYTPPTCSTTTVKTISDDIEYPLYY